MVPIKFASLVLGLLFVLHALRNSSAHAHPGKIMNGLGLTATTKNFASAQKEFLDRIPSSAARKMGSGGRKMVVDKEEGLKGETSKISGKDTDASHTSLRRSQYRSIDQNNSKMLEPKTSRSASLGIPGNDGIAHKDEAQRLLKATHEIVTLMVKDYKGMDKPRRKPPINNDEPTD